MPDRNTTLRLLAVGAAGAALLAACNFPGMGSHNAANATNVAAGPAMGLGGGNAVGLDSGSGMDATNVAALPPALPPTAASGPVPDIRQGRWSQTSTTDSGAPETEVVCLPGGPLRMEFSRECPVPSPSPGPDGSWVVETTCTGRMGPVNVRLVSTGDYQNHYSMDGQFSLRPADPNTPPRSLHIHMEAVYQGPCQPGEGTPATPPQQPQQPQQGGDGGGEDSGGDK